MSNLIGILAFQVVTFTGSIPVLPTTETLENSRVSIFLSLWTPSQHLAPKEKCLFLKSGTLAYTNLFYHSYLYNILIGRGLRMEKFRRVIVVKLRPGQTAVVKCRRHRRRRFR